MFQSFDSSTDPGTCASRVAAVRRLMRRERLDGLIVPRSDAHQGEYVPAAAERLAWLASFTGSAGCALITHDRAILFVDGRYTLQAQSQTDLNTFEIHQIRDPIETELLRGIASALPAKGVVGMDPWLHTIDQFEAIRSRAAKSGHRVRSMSRNLIDVAWQDCRPPMPCGPIQLHDERLAGQSAKAKIAALQSVLRNDGDDALIMTASDNIAWLLNIRGSDVPHNPIVLAFAIILSEGKIELFVDKNKADKPVRNYILQHAKIFDLDALPDRLKALSDKPRRIRLDPRAAPYWFHQRLRMGAGECVRAADPVSAMKARKNAAELEGARRAHERDGIALCRFLAWLDQAVETEQIDEITVVEKLEWFRSRTGMLKEISFDTIAGSGPNGAIVHYRVTRSSNRMLRDGDILLLDSGAQYEDGTTDVTRTIAVGTPSDIIRKHYTLVLKGHIAISVARFPVGTRGHDIDALARTSLWQHGLDYDHGTGHGVGSYLSVHEGPQSISRRGAHVLEPGMILSNEPGYYKAGRYGIRIENLCVVTPAVAIKSGDLAMLGFETLSLAPYDRNLIDPNMLSDFELDWLNSYHATVRQRIGPHLEVTELDWLDAATRSIG